MVASFMFAFAPVVASRMRLSGALVGKKDILPNVSTSTGNLDSPNPAFLKMHVSMSQRHQPSENSLVGSDVMQNAQWEWLHLVQNNLGFLTKCAVDVDDD